MPGDGNLYVFFSLAFACSKYGKGHQAINIHSFANLGFNVRVTEMKSLEGMKEMYKDFSVSVT